MASLLVQVLNGTDSNNALFTDGKNPFPVSAASMVDPFDPLLGFWPLDIHLKTTDILTIEATTTNPAINATYTPIVDFIVQDEAPERAATTNES
jgi:hypothetical protein